MAAFTHYWTNRTAADAIDAEEENLPLNHVASNLFVKRGVAVGDRIYVITVRKGELFLIGCLTVDIITHSDSEAQRMLGYEPWHASDHLIANAEHCTPMNFHRRVPLEVVKQLRFEAIDGENAPKFKSDWALDQQTLRGVRRLSNDSAALLDAVIGA